MTPEEREAVKRFAEAVLLLQSAVGEMIKQLSICTNSLKVLNDLLSEVDDDE